CLFAFTHRQHGADVRSPYWSAARRSSPVARPLRAGGSKSLAEDHKTPRPRRSIFPSRTVCLHRRKNTVSWGTVTFWITVGSALAETALYRCVTKGAVNVNTLPQNRCGMSPNDP